MPYIDISVDCDFIPPTKKRLDTWWEKMDWLSFIQDKLEVKKIEGDKIYIRCPNESYHTTPSKEETCIFINDNHPGFSCLHAHCVGLTLKDILEPYDYSDFEPYLPKEDINLDTEKVDIGETGPNNTTQEDVFIDENDLPKGKISRLGEKENYSIYSSLNFLGETNTGALAIKSKDSEVIKFIAPRDVSIKTCLGIFSDTSAWYGPFSISSGKIIRFDIEAATEWLVKESKKSGSYENKKKSGLGLHLDDLNSKNVVVLNTGNKVYCQGTFYSYEESWKLFENYYIMAPRKINFTDKTMPPNLPSEMFGLLSTLSFRTKEEACVFFGACIVLMMSGAVPIRPYTRITGPTQSGKSVIITLIANPLLKAAGGMIYSVGTSAAGLVQSLGGNVPLTFDEFEPNSVQNAKQIDIIEEFLLAATTSGAEVYKGTKLQIPIQNSFKTGGIFGSIGSKDSSAALEIRTININIVNSMDTSEQWLEKKKKLEALFTRENCEMIFRYLVDNIDLFIQNIETCANLCSKRKEVIISSATLYGAILGGLVTLIRQRPFDLDKDKSIVSAVFKVMMESCENKQKTLDNIKVDIFNTLFSLELKDIHENKSYTCGELLTGILIDKDCSEDFNSRILSYYGIRIIEDYLWISNKNLNLSAAFEKFKIYGYSDRLKAIKDIKNSDSTIRFGGSLSRARGIPISIIKDKLSPEPKSNYDPDPEIETLQF